MNASATSPADAPAATAIRIRSARQPIVPVTFAVILGITASSYWPVQSEIWLIGSLLSMSLGIWGERRRGARGVLSRGLLLLSAAMLAGGWYRVRTVASADDVSQFLRDESMLARVRGRLSSEPVTASFPLPFERESGGRSRQTKMFVLVNEIQWEEGWRACGGKVEVRVAGVAGEVHAGDEVEILGWLSRPYPPASEGEYDYPAFLKLLGVYATLKCEHPDGVTRLSAASGYSLTGFMDRLRQAGRGAFHRYLSPATAPLADALVLGFRTSLSREDVEPFQETGTLHLLVVSGTHVFVLVAFFMVLSNGIGLSPPARMALVAGFVLLYAMVTGGDPPVLRAALVTNVWLVGFLIRRTPRPINSLAGAALLVLILDPASLFRIGSQLSFLAVLTILLMIPSLNRVIEGQYSQYRSDGRWFSVARHFIVRWVSECLVVSGVVSLVVAPLILDRFHLLTPSSVLLSVVLLPLITVALVLGGLLLVFAGLLPPAAWLLAYPTEACLWLVRLAVQSADPLPFAHVYLPAPPTWWTVVFYLLLFLPGCLWGRRAIGRGYLCANLGWQCLGVMLYIPGNAPTEVEYHQLAVGHGNCGVLRYPTGETILYDCGSLASGDVTDRTVAPWLWSKRIRRIDAVFVSHADVDHFNGLARLARRFPLGALFITPQIARSKQPEVRTLLEQLMRDKVPIRIVWQGDRFLVGGVEHRILEPSVKGVYRTDNAASMVMECVWRGHSLLLTGDIEAEGLARLMARPRRELDVMVAPHHGSRSSNNEGLARWANPRVVLSTQGKRKTLDDPLCVYAYFGATTLRTDREGTIACRWTPGGLVVECHRTGQVFRVAFDEASRSVDREMARDAGVSIP